MDLVELTNHFPKKGMQLIPDNIYLSRQNKWNQMYNNADAGYCVVTTAAGAKHAKTSH